MKIEQNTKVKIQEKIAEIEKQTNAELVCMVTPKSSSYIMFPLFLSALLALLLPLVQPVSNLIGYNEIILTFQHQTIAFLAFTVILVFTPLKTLATPKWLKYQNCQRYSVEQFFSKQLHNTKDKSGVMLFVSNEERFVTIIADKGISQKVDQLVWDNIITNFTSKVKDKKLEEGFLEALEDAGDLLIKHFPAKKKNNDELPNHFIELGKPPYIS